MFKVSSVFKPVQSYFDLTVTQPYESVKKISPVLKQSVKKAPNGAIYLARHIAKQKSLVSPESVKSHDRSLSVRRHYLGYLETQGQWGATRFPKK